MGMNAFLLSTFCVIAGVMIGDANKCLSKDTCYHKEAWWGCCGAMSDYMKKNCPKQCQGGRKDRISNCASLKKNGWCEKAAKPWMQINCCKTCGSSPITKAPTARIGQRMDGVKRILST